MTRKESTSTIVYYTSYFIQTVIKLFKKKYKIIWKTNVSRFYYYIRVVFRLVNKLSLNHQNSAVRLYITYNRHQLVCFLDLIKPFRRVMNR